MCGVAYVRRCIRAASRLCGVAYGRRFVPALSSASFTAKEQETQRTRRSPEYEDGRPRRFDLLSCATLRQMTRRIHKGREESRNRRGHMGKGKRLRVYGSVFQ